MEVYYGLHATTRSRVALIRQDGFRRGSGRVGTGVYFWRKGPYALGLARQWYEYLNSKQAFSSETDGSIAILSCSIRAERHEVLDLESPEMKDFVGELLQSRSISMALDEVDICAFYDYVVSEFDREHSHALVMLIARVAAPPRFGKFEYPIRFLGAPLSYIVRVTERITIDEELR